MQERIQLFLELVACNQPLFYWRYDPMGNLLESTCQTEKMLDEAFRLSGALENAVCTETDQPMILGSNSFMLWVADREMENGKCVALHILGPFFANEVHEDTIEHLIRQLGFSTGEQWNQALAKILLGLPAVSTPLYCQYAIMLHYLLSGKVVPPGDILYAIDSEETVPSDFSNLKVHARAKDRREIYRLERALLNAVREGDIEAASLMSGAGQIARVRQYTDNFLRNVQIACTTFVTLCTRAAIEGGLSTTMSYCIGDAYIKSIFLAKSATEVSSIKNQMYRDFITRVHNCRRNPDYSKMVQSCCDYIELHLGEPLSIEVLADRLGYAKYYLSARFKKETNATVGDYIKYARIERAKMLLATTDKSIAEIAEQTGFASRSFFSNTFKRCLGITPAAYRKEKAST